MTNIITLLVTRNQSVINDIQRLHDDIDSARLEVCGRFEKVLPRLGRDNALLLIQAAPDTDPDRLRSLLAAAERSLVKAVIITHHAAGQEDPPPQFGGHPTYHLPADLLALRQLIENVHTASAAQFRAVDNSSALPPVDPVTATLFGCELSGQLTRIHRVAGQNTTILLTGETGCGKSMLAKFIHTASPRRNEPYLVVDCGALSGQLIESEMFGHVRGAFTGAERERQGKFAAAGVGTLVLDEINSLPLPLQAKLLRAVEDRVFEPVGSNKSEPLRARLVAISNVPLEEEVAKGRFRADLFYRLNVVEFRLPPLRERPVAVIPLAHQLLRGSATAACQGVTTISPAALDAMLSYNWPGNVRELRNVIERASALASGPVIQLADLPDHIRARATPSIKLHTESASMMEPMESMESMELPDLMGDEASRIITVLRKHNNNRRAAAAELGMSRVSLYKKLHKYGLFVRKVRTCAVG